MRPAWNSCVRAPRLSSAPAVHCKGRGLPSLLVLAMSARVGCDFAQLRERVQGSTPRDCPRRSASFSTQCSNFERGVTRTAGRTDASHAENSACGGGQLDAVVTSGTPVFERRWSTGALCRLQSRVPNRAIPSRRRLWSSRRFAAQECHERTCSGTCAMEADLKPIAVDAIHVALVGSQRGAAGDDHWQPQNGARFRPRMLSDERLHDNLPLVGSRSDGASASDAWD